MKRNTDARKSRTIEKHQKIRDLYAQRYTNQKRVNGARKYTSTYVIACLAEEFYLSMRQIENIVYTKAINHQLPAASTEAPAALPLAA